MANMVIEKKYIETHVVKNNLFSYQPAIGVVSNKKLFVWTRLVKNRDFLFGRFIGDGDTFEISETPGKILSMVVVNNFILWSQEDKEKDWRLHVRRFKSDRLTPVEKISRKGCRIQSINVTQSPDEPVWIVYEERLGKKTYIKASYFREDSWKTDVSVTDGKFNCYDPKVALDNNGDVFVIYCGFRWGNYHIFVQRIDSEGKCIGTPQLVSNQDGICYWPSIYKRSDGGMWLSWTSFDAIRLRKTESTFVRHYKYKACEKVFDSYTRLYAGVLSHGRLFAPFAPKNVAGGGVITNEGPMAAMRVGDAVYGKYPAIFEDKNGCVHIVYRRHKDSKDGINKDYLHPDISITTLLHDGWSDSRSLIDDSGMESPISYVLDDEHLYITFFEDKREPSRERFDKGSTISVGYLMLNLHKTQKSKNHLIPYILSGYTTPSIEEEVFGSRQTEYKIAFGQLHCHTNFSVCNRIGDGNIDLNYRFFHDVQHSDFGCVTDHEFNQGMLEEHINRKMADFYYFPGSFVALPGYEWTGSGNECRHGGGPFGHVNVIWFEEDSDLPFHTPKDKDAPGNTLVKLWRILKGKRVLTIPHHTADYMHFYNWYFYDGSFVPVVEIFQDRRGSHEHPTAPGVVAYYKKEENGSWVLDALERGYLLGFVGGGDHFGIARAGLLVQELTREGLYEALVKRRALATTGTAMKIDFRADSFIMGSLVQKDSVKFRLNVESHLKVKELQIVRNGENYDVKSINARKADIKWTAVRKLDREFWYCRVILENGEMVWTSPIWLEKKV